MRFRLSTIFFLVIFPVVAQAQVVDSLMGNFVRKPQTAIDSIQFLFYTKVDSLKEVYRGKLGVINAGEDAMRSKIDSLQSIQQPVAKYLGKLDSINWKRGEATVALNDNVERLKSRALEKLGKIPPTSELGRITSLATKNIEEFKLPVKDFNLPSLKVPGNSLNGLDAINSSIDSPIGKIGEIGGLIDISAPLGDVSKLTEQVSGLAKITDQVGEVSKDVQNIAKGDLGEVKALPNAIETRAAEVTGLDQLKQVQNPEAVKQQALEQAQQAAVDHFAGKEQQLQQAMQQMSKLKQKYSSLNSLSEIPKLVRNQMAGKPFVERLIPGIGFQILKNGDDFMVDFNPYAGYRLTGRLTTGLGWNQRFAYNTVRNSLNSAARIFGPRAYLEFKLGKGFFPRSEFEIMNTFVPPFVRQLSSDAKEREWVPGIFLGMKKEFRFFKKVNGTSMIMTRLYNPDHKSPYSEVVNVRFGFEFPLKKRSKKL